MENKASGTLIYKQEFTRKEFPNLFVYIADIEASSSQPVHQVRTSSLSAGYVADDAASTSTQKPAPSSSTDATVANNSHANLTSYQKRNSLLAVPTRTSSRNQPSPDTSGNALAGSSSNARKRRKRKDGDGSSVNTGQSTTEGRTHKPHQGGGISKFFSVFLKCCRAPSDTSGDLPARKAQKPQSVRGARSTAEVPGAKNNSLKDSGIDTESKDAVMEEKKTEPIQVDGDVQTSAPTVPESELSEKQGFMGENVLLETPTPSDEASQSVSKAVDTVCVEPPMTVREDIEAIRPSTSSPVPQTLTTSTKEDVVMTDSESEAARSKAPLIKTELPPLPAPEAEEDDEIKAAVEEHSPIADEPIQDITVEIQPAEQKQWLLPPLKPEMQGKKCLVLDLDETLVHSSFKVILDFKYPDGPLVLI